MVNVLQQIAEKYSEIELVLIKHTYSPDFLNIKGANVRDFIIPSNSASGPKILWLGQTKIYKALKDIAPDFLFCPYPHVPFFYRKTVTTVHDCAYDHFPKESYFTIRLYMKLMFLSIKLFAPRIITVSDASKKDLAMTWHIDPNRIIAVHTALPQIPVVEIKDADHLLNRYGLCRQKYFIFVGAARPRKNLLGIVRAFKQFSGEFRDYRLVLVGRRDAEFDKIAEEVTEMGIQDEVILTGYISEVEKILLYKEACAVVFPSLYEGFGLPILEGQTVGVPVVTSNNSSMPEVGGAAALYVDPYSTDSIAGGLKKIASDVSLRSELVKKGFENIKKFSFEKTARETVKIFEEIA